MKERTRQCPCELPLYFKAPFHTSTSRDLKVMKVQEKPDPRKRLKAGIMTLPYNLEDSLANFGLLSKSKKSAQQPGTNQNIARRHIISFQYPAPELLWPGDKEFLHLDTPANIEQRHSALNRHVQPPDFSIDFFCVLPIEERPVMPPQSHNDYQSVLRAVSLLETKQGTSTFSVVRLATQGACMNIRTRIRIDSSLEGNLSLREDFELSEEQWQGLLRWSGGFQWIQVLKNLVYRESDRACYHVEDAVEKIWPWNVILQHENHLNAMWDTRPPRTTEGNESELAIGEQRRQLGEWLQQNALWKDLDNADFSLRTEVLQIKAGTLYHVFHAAFDSMKSVELLCPSSMAFVNLAETKTGLEALEAFPFGSEQIISGTAAQIQEGLFQKVKDAVIDSNRNTTLAQIPTVPGFWDSVKVLLVRTMNFWLRRSCRKTNGAHYKFHLHEGVPFFSPSSWDASQQSNAVLDDSSALEEMKGEEEVSVDALDAFLTAMEM